MSKSDWIEVINSKELGVAEYTSIFVATISLITICFLAYNSGLMKKQVETQLIQWEHSHNPIFKLIYLQSYNANEYTIIIDNTNNVYHKIENITSSANEVSILDHFYGEVHKESVKKSGVVKNELYKGLAVILAIKSQDRIIASIQITGKDALGNSFKYNVKDLKFLNQQLYNDLEIVNTYLEKV